MFLNIILISIVAVSWFADMRCDVLSNMVNQTSTTNQTAIPTSMALPSTTSSLRNSDGVIASSFGFGNFQPVVAKKSDDWIGYFNYLHSKDSDSCLSRFICEAISRPWNFEDYGYKVQRFFFLYTPDATNVAGNYYKNVASMSYFIWNCATQYPSCQLTESEIQTVAKGQLNGGFP